MNSSIICVLIFTVLCTNNLFASKESTDIENGFKSYNKGLVVMPSEKDRPKSLQDLFQNKNHTILQVLYVLQEIRNDRMKANLSDIKTLLKLHRAKTFKAMYPDSWKYVRATDYEEMLCSKIEELLKEKTKAD